MTKDEIFAAMEKAYTGAGSTVEGSFAGDLLRACADGCAELWSTEIDGLEERAFVASAAGEWLTRVCADRGVERRAGEDDETLRSRALESLKRQGASGNADDYAAWCGTVEGLLRVRVLPLARGAGTVDIVAVGQDGQSRERGGGRGGAERRGRKAPHRRGREGVCSGRKAAEHCRERRSERGREPRRGRKRI